MNPSFQLIFLFISVEELAIHYYKPLEKRTYTVKVLVRLNASGSIILIGLSESILEKKEYSNKITAEL